MTYLWKGRDPISEKKSLDSYFTNTAIAGARKCQQELSANKLMLFWAKGANRKARHKALKKLCALAEYGVATAENRELMEKQVVTELEDSRAIDGISAAVVLDAQVAKAIHL